MWTVPPPPAHDPGAPVAKEAQAVYGPGGVPGADGMPGADGVPGRS
jgi:hypothetical protein